MSEAETTTKVDPTPLNGAASKSTSSKPPKAKTPRRRPRAGLRRPPKKEALADTPTTDASSSSSPANSTPTDATASSTPQADAPAPTDLLPPEVETPDPPPYREIMHVIPWYRPIEQPDLAEDGFERRESALLYSSEANDWKPMKVLVLRWMTWGGLGEILIAKSLEPVKVRMGDGSIFEVPPKIEFGIQATQELHHIVNDFQDDPKVAGVEAIFAPNGVRITEDGRPQVHYQVHTKKLYKAEKKA